MLPLAEAGERAHAVDERGRRFGLDLPAAAPRRARLLTPPRPRRRTRGLVAPGPVRVPDTSPPGSTSAPQRPIPWDIVSSTGGSPGCERPDPQSASRRSSPSNSSLEQPRGPAAARAESCSTSCARTSSAPTLELRRRERPVPRARRADPRDRLHRRRRRVDGDDLRQPADRGAPRLHAPGVHRRPGPVGHDTCTPTTGSGRSTTYLDGPRRRASRSRTSTG